MEKTILSDKDLHCIARMLQDMWSERDTRCLYCKYAFQCLEQHNTTQKIPFFETLEKLQGITGVKICLSSPGTMQKGKGEVMNVEGNFEREILEKREKKHQVVVESNGVNKTTISIDGVELSDVITEIRFRPKGGLPPVMEIELRRCDISVRSPHIPQLPEALAAFYKPTC